jgi:ComF family protein
LRALVHRIADVIVPPVCLACQARILDHDALCPSCWRTVAFIRPPLCDRLGIPLPFAGPDEGPIVSAAAMAEPPPYDRARAVAVFDGDGVLRDLVHSLKFADRQEPRRLLGRWLAEAGRDILKDADLLIPVPLTRWRLMRRQFNQSALLAQEVGRLTGLPMNPLCLVKCRSTPPQVGLTREQRRRNVRGAFSVPSRRAAQIAGRRVVLVDDVITTGATVGACARALRAAGAQRIDVLAVGLVTKPIQVTV